MPLAEHDRVVSGGLKELRRGLLGSVENIKDGRSVHVGIFSRQHRGSARGANRVAHKRVVEADAVAAELVEARCQVDLRSVSRDRVRGVVICHDEQDVRALRRGLRSGGQ